MIISPGHDPRPELKRPPSINTRDTSKSFKRSQGPGFIVVCVARRNRSRELLCGPRQAVQSSSLWLFF